MEIRKYPLKAHVYRIHHFKLKTIVTHHQVKHGVHGERRMSGEERLPEGNRRQSASHQSSQCPQCNTFLKDGSLQFVAIPGLLDFTLRALTLVLGDVAQGAVDGGEVRLAHVEEVGAHAAHRHLGDVGEGLADRAAEDEHAHLLVERGHVGVPYERLGSLVQKVDPVALPDDNLQGW